MLLLYPVYLIQNKLFIALKSLQLHHQIFTLANNFLWWTYFGLMRFIYRWMTLVHAKLCVSDATVNKGNSWMADVTFDWHHVMETAVVRNNQTCRFITFLHRSFYKIYIKTSLTVKVTIQKQSVNIRDEFQLLWHSSKYEGNGSRAKLTWLTLHETHCVHLRNKSHFSEAHQSMNTTDHVQSKWCPKGIVNFARDLLRSYFDEPQKNEIHLIFTHSFDIVFVHYLWNFDLNLANKGWRKVIIQHVW